MDADAWIHTIESKFSLLEVPCSDANKAHFATQQLRGTARLWWDHYNVMLPADHIVTWDEFKNTFRAHHIPEGLMERKLNEFLGLTQGTHTVIQYVQAFNDSCHYTGHHADTDAKKRDHFRRGLCTKLKDHLNPIKVDTYYKLVKLAITQEDCIMAHHAEKKRKAPAVSSSAPPQRYLLVQHATHQAPQKAPHQGRWVFKPPPQQGVSHPPVPQQTIPRLTAQQPARPISTNRCFNCRDPNHFIRECPQARQRNQGQGSRQNRKNKGKVQNVLVRQGRINFTTLTDLLEGAPVMTGIFSIHHKPAVILFYSWASHGILFQSHERIIYDFNTRG